MITSSLHCQEIYMFDKLILCYNKDLAKTGRPQSTEEEVVPRFTLGLSSRPRAHLVPLPWQQLDSSSSKDTCNNNRM